MFCSPCALRTMERGFASSWLFLEPSQTGRGSPVRILVRACFQLCWQGRLAAGQLARPAGAAVRREAKQVRNLAVEQEPERQARKHKCASAGQAAPPEGLRPVRQNIKTALSWRSHVPWVRFSGRQTKRAKLASTIVRRAVSAPRRSCYAA